MLNTIKSILGFGPKVDYAELVKNGAQIIDVRSKGEFNGGHIKGSVNIPLDTISGNMKKIKKDKPVITVCASGMRSGIAKGQLQSAGYEAYNGGSWAGLQNKI